MAADEIKNNAVADDVIRDELLKALLKRREYCAAACHSFPATVAAFLIPSRRNQTPLDDEISSKIPSFEQFKKDYQFLCDISSSPSLNSFCEKRLSTLSDQFSKHQQDSLSTMRVPRSHDLYDIPKVDTHIHVSSCMTQKGLLDFIKRKLTHNGDDIVLDDGTTLKQVFDRMNLTAKDLNVDLLDTHADRQTFQRFDVFNGKFNLMGQSRLREIFLKTDNFIGGRYFAEIIKEMAASEEEANRVHYYEMRISVYGRSADEWTKLAKWADTFQVYPPNIRWLVQMPRIYRVLKRSKAVTSFGQMMDNFFRPLFQATLNPQEDPALDYFLRQLVGFDSVDDESKPEVKTIHQMPENPDEWDSDDDPPYAYYLYCMFANICALNKLRKSKGMNILVFRPHSGEAGPVEHLASAFLLADNIAHGLQLRKAPVLEYLYYLAQIGIAMAPTCNHYLFLEFHRNPCPEFFARGLIVTLSTDGPLQFHFTSEPLMEEYGTACHLWTFGLADVCELARNSIVTSGLDDQTKRTLIDQLDRGYKASFKSRLIYRQNALELELSYVTKKLSDSIEMK